jgi:alpha-L-fucosidase 2
LNEETFGSGGPSRNDNPKALEALPKIRELIFSGKFKEAEAMVNENMHTITWFKYQVVGDLIRIFQDMKLHQLLSRTRFGTAIFKTTYQVDGVTYSAKCCVTARQVLW